MEGVAQAFCDLAPKWGLVARRVVFDYPATRLLVEALQRLYDDGTAEPSLPEFVRYRHPSFTVELFFRGDENVRERVLTSDADLRGEKLDDGGVYHSPTVFQLEAMLFHAGILSERGKDLTARPDRGRLGAAGTVTERVPCRLCSTHESTTTESVTFGTLNKETVLPAAVK